MEASLRDKVYRLLAEVSSIPEVKAIGQTGNIDIEPKAGESDIDIFVLCERIPDFYCRKNKYDRNSILFSECRLNVCEGGVWGTGDIFTIDGIETMLMYFSIDETFNYIDDILSGKYPDKIDGFYPVGRCATFLGINILHDENGILALLKEKLKQYPGNLKNKIVECHLGKCIDREDFNRAVRRKDVLFYHMVLENSLDHYLQTLFAVNDTFFPSRKSTKQYLDSFDNVPVECYDRLLKMVKLGSSPEGIEESFFEWSALVKELYDIWDNIN